MDGNGMTYATQWTHATPALSKEQEEHLQQEIELISDELDCASDLIFHTVFLTKDDNGAIVIVEGREDEHNTLYLTYYETPTWVTL